MANQARGFPHVLDEQRGWIHRDFLKEKLRVRERYWRSVADAPPSLGTSERGCWVIPDGVSWRKFLPLLTQLVERSVCNLVLLESAVELLDYRSMSPCVMVEQDGSAWSHESPAPQERSKIRKLLQNYPNRVVSFCDLSVREEDHDEWDMMGYATMSMSERSQHALVRAGNMIHQYCSGADILILSSDSEFVKQFPSEDGVDLVVMNQLLDQLVEKQQVLSDNIDTLAELKTRCEQDYRLRNTPSVKSGTKEIAKYLSDEDISEGLRNKTLAKGRLNVTKENPKEAFVVASSGDSYFINQQLGHFNRALHQDIVVLQPLAESDWGRPVGRRRLVHHRDDDDDGPTSEVDSSPPVPSARVVAVTESSRRLFVATMVDVPMNDESACLVIPMDVRIPKIRIKTSGWRRFVGNRLLIQLDAWDLGSNFPAGHCVEILGPVAGLETEIKCLLHENQLDLEPFSAAALACLPPEGPDWMIPAEEMERRLDLRATHRIFSVDPPGCQDIDDTMHARVLPNGDIEVGVHIADVTYFVPHNSALDKEAQIRGTTFYLVDRRFDMLPALLSSDLCSLHGDTDRLAVSTMWTMSSDLMEIKSFWHGKTVIHNCQAMTYDQAHNILHDKPPDDNSKPRPPPLTAGAPVNSFQISALKHDLSILTQLSRKLRKDREDIGGAVDLSSGDQGSELKFSLDENNNPTRVTPKKQEEIHQTIAEMMILANTWVAKTIHERMPDSALLRVHRSAEDSRFEDLKEVLKAGKIKFDGSSNMALAKSLKQAEETTKSGSLMSLFQSLATRAMSEAQYICTGQAAGGETGLSHYGLGLQKYTHFTSPIRRYADVVVHKQLLIEPAVSHKGAEGHQGPRRQGLSSLPTSKVVSILGGEALVDKSKGTTEFEENLDIQEPSPQQSNGALASNISAQGTDQLALYESKEVTRICERLNYQNRMAKLSSFQCQSLFLSLYFKEHTETTQAVVTNLRTNGFWVYVPRFDMRGPVYLSDVNGNVQIDPALLNLSPSAGLEPSVGFAGSGRARMFPSGRCTLVDSPDEFVEAVIPESNARYRVRVLDVVVVKICCDTWDTRSRVPLPKLHLLAKSKEASTTSTTSKHNTRPTKGTITPPVPHISSNTGKSSGRDGGFFSTRTLYEETLKLQTPPVLPDVLLRSQANRSVSEPSGTPTMPGRIIFGNFRNPDTHSAKQEVAIAEASEAAKERRKHLMAAQAHTNEFDTSRRIEMDATARMQRLAASKRSARRNKG